MAIERGNLTKIGGQLENRPIVGAKRRPDGTMDYSRAMVMLDPVKMPQVSPAINRQKQPEKESLEVKELRELEMQINRESAKIIWASMDQEEWRKVGNTSGSGQSMGVDGKKLKGFDYNDPNSKRNLYQYVSPDNLGAPKILVFNENVYENYMTYRLSPLRENIYEKTMVDEEVDVPRIILGRQIGTKKEKRKAIKEIQKGQRPALMADKIEGGDQQEAFLFALKRDCREFSGRPATVDLALILPRELALKTYQFLQKNPKMIDKLFEEILPAWIMNTSSGIKFQPSKHVHGEISK